VYLKKATGLLSAYPKGKYKLVVNNSDISKMVGQKRDNIKALSLMGYDCTVSGAESVSPFDILIKQM
jgi:transcription antitermination factor NusA-like protein